MRAKQRVVIGDHAIRETLEVSYKSVAKLLVRANWESSADLRQIVEVAKRRRLKVEECSPAQLDKLGTHQGAAVYAEYPETFEVSCCESEERATLLALDGLEDPHNLGAIIRTAWLVGVKGILASADRSVGLSATVHKVASGGVEHVPVGFYSQFGQIFGELKEQGFWIFGLSHKTDKSIFDLKVPEKVVWVLGSEERGLRSTTMKVCDEVVKLPQTSPQASYNVSAAAAMALMHSMPRG